MESNLVQNWTQLENSFEKYSNHMFNNLKNPLQNHTEGSIKLIQLTQMKLEVHFKIENE
jgi:hypothetical protein